jgi:hypothetical protein
MTRTKHRSSTYYIYGKRNCGKSTLALDIYNHRKNIDTNVMCVTNERLVMQEDIRNQIPDKFIFDEYHTNLLGNVIDRQRIIIGNQQNHKMPDIVVILDDCLSARTLSNDKHLENIFLNGRCHGISLIITSQIPYGMPPTFRTNVAFTFLFGGTTFDNKRKLYDYWAGWFPTIEMFSVILDQLTENYCCMVIDNTDHSDNLLDKIFWYEVDMPEYIAAVAISNWWLGILDRRQLCRLKINRELELYPGVGIKYLEARTSFNLVQK